MSNQRCWCCGTKLIDVARLKNRKCGSYSFVFNPTDVMVCPYRCPSPEEAEQQKAEGRDEAESHRST